MDVHAAHTELFLVDQSGSGRISADLDQQRRYLISRRQSLPRRPRAERRIGTGDGSSHREQPKRQILASVLREFSTRRGGARLSEGVRLHPNAQSGSLALDTWNYVSVDLTPLAGKTVNRVDFGYDNPNSTGGYRGYVDDIAFTTPG